MTAALTPELALEYLGQLSTDIRAGVVLDAQLRPLAGDGDLASPAAALLAVAGSPQVEVVTAAGCVFGARAQHHAIVVAAGPHALPALVRYDVRRTLGDLEPAAG